jgi:hypothetical protein
VSGRAYLCACSSVCNASQVIQAWRKGKPPGFGAERRGSALPTTSSYQKVRRLRFSRNIIG